MYFSEDSELITDSCAPLLGFQITTIALFTTPAILILITELNILHQKRRHQLYYAEEESLVETQNESLKQIFIKNAIKGVNLQKMTVKYN